MAKTKASPTRRTVKSWLEEFRSVKSLAGATWLTQTLGLNEEQIEVLLSLPAAYFASGDIGIQCHRLHQAKFPLQEGQDLVDITLKLVARLLERGVVPEIYPRPEQPAPEIPNHPPSLYQLRRLDWAELILLTIAITGDKKLPLGLDKDSIGIWLYHKANKEFGSRAHEVMADAYRRLGFPS